ncbi:MAG: GNAT family N-acetyltransferase [Lachnospiraceae bacterium]|nr:GNAT family N-acetyltransferase [Lachnospiraceae bacterium]MCM1230478.1 GNAT family N-acetyltransferase [Ruminococcus flavefaciens]
MKRATFFGTLSDNDEYKSQHLPIARAMMTADMTYEKCFVAIINDEIVGYIYGFVVSAKVTLPQFLYVKKSQRGNGIGAALLKHFEAEAGIPCSLIYYRNELHDYYTKQGHESGTAEVAMSRYLQKRKRYEIQIYHTALPDRGYRQRSAGVQRTVVQRPLFLPQRRE